MERSTLLVHCCEDCAPEVARMRRLIRLAATELETIEGGENWRQAEDLARRLLQHQKEVNPARSHQTLATLTGGQGLMERTS